MRWVVGWHFGVVARDAVIVYLQLLRLVWVEILEIAQQLIISKLIEIIFILQRIQQSCS